MTALSVNTSRREVLAPGIRSWRVRVSLEIFQGALVGHRIGSSILELMSARNDLICVGVATNYVLTGSTSVTSMATDPTQDDGFGGTQFWTCNTTVGVHGELDTGTGSNAVTAEHIGLPCYAIDTNTVYITNPGGAYSIAGIVHTVDPDDGRVTIKVEEDPIVQLALGASAEGAPYGGGGLSASAFMARGVVYNNQASLTAFTVASDDGLTYTEGQVVLLAGQTTAAQCGPYVVGAVAGGTAPLTRPAWWAGGDPVINGKVIEVSEGTFYAGSSWKAMCTGAKVIDTDDPLFYPRVFKLQIVLAAGTFTIGVGSTATPDEPLFLFSTTKSQVAVHLVTANTTTSTTEYNAVGASRVAGKHGTAVLLVRANVAAGTINAADISTLDVTATNW